MQDNGNIFSPKGDLIHQWRQEQKDKIDIFVLSTITLLANKYNIHPDINIEARTINFHGGSDKDQAKLAQDIDDTLYRYSL